MIRQYSGKIHSIHPINQAIHTQETRGRRGAARVKYQCVVRSPFRNDPTRLFSNPELL
jgi:hypothetical protein